MDSYSYAHTAPVWIGSVGSTDPIASRAAARDLLRALDVADRRIDASYGNAPIPNLRGHFQKARQILMANANSAPDK
jgi:TolB protein